MGITVKPGKAPPPPLKIPLILSNFLDVTQVSSKQFYLFNDFQSDQIQRSYRKIFTAYYECRNADLNLTPNTGTTNGFIFQIINSLIEC